MLTSVLAENGSKKEMLERKCGFFSRPNFRIQRVYYVVISISNSSFTSTLEQQRSDKVCVFKARLSAFEVSQLYSEFFCSNSRCSSWRLPVWNTITYYKRGTLLCVKSLLCQDFSMWNVHFPWPDKLTQPPSTRHALHPFINALSKLHGVYMNWILRCCACCSASRSVTEFLCYIASCVTMFGSRLGMWSCYIWLRFSYIIPIRNLMGAGGQFKDIKKNFTRKKKRQIWKFQSNLNIHPTLVANISLAKTLTKRFCLTTKRGLIPLTYYSSV